MHGIWKITGKLEIIRVVKNQNKICFLLFQLYHLVVLAILISLLKIHQNADLHLYTKTSEMSIKYLRMLSSEK